MRQIDNMRRQKRAILFDLDGTLLPLDTEEFVKVYTKELAKHVAHIVEPDAFIKALWAGTGAMIKNTDSAKNNEQVFTENFLGLLMLEKEQIWPTLDSFYREVFSSFAYLSTPTDTALAVVEAALEKGYQVALATNPVFPAVATLERMSWAGLTEKHFKLITTYENSFFTKPHLQYYQNIADELQVSATDCIMIGNDKQEDMAAAQLGMRTYLTEECLIDRGKPDYPVHARGTLEDLLMIIKNEEGIFN